MATYVLLLRGINLGARRRLPMADLREALEGLGYDDVRTHLQSGNVVLRATGSAAAVKQRVEGALADHCGFDVEVLVRTKAQLDTVAVHGKEVYLWLPKGVHDSRLAREATGKGVGTATARNWNVVTRLAELAAGRPRE